MEIMLYWRHAHQVTRKSLPELVPVPQLSLVFGCCRCCSGQRPVPFHTQTEDSSCLHSTPPPHLTHFQPVRGSHSLSAQKWGVLLLGFHFCMTEYLKLKTQEPRPQTHHHKANCCKVFLFWRVDFSWWRFHQCCDDKSGHMKIALSVLLASQTRFLCKIWIVMYFILYLLGLIKVV